MAQKQSTSPWVWALLLLMLLSFVAFILFLDQKIVSQGTSSKSQQPSQGSENKPTIDFYSVLPKRKVEIPISEEDREAIENPTLNKDAVDQSILQVGSFQYLSSPGISRIVPGLMSVLGGDDIFVKGTFFEATDEVWMETTTPGVFET